MLLLWVFVAYGAIASCIKSQPTATIANGKVIGTSIPGVNQFLGIPFAASPPERFGPPCPHSKWKAWDATVFRPACLQQLNGPEEAHNFTINMVPTSESEDCLYLNIYAPSKCRELKPVMFWIYGGNLQSGYASLFFYNGSSFAKSQDVVVVTANYRTNVFGFPGSPELANGKQNLGFLDQRFALQWVQDNIEAFGGDPKQVTIFGESAGAYSVKQLLAAPPSPLPFRAAIMESQAALEGPSSYEALLNATGCNVAPSGLNCLRNVPATDLQSIVQQNRFGFPPIFDSVTAVRLTGPVFESGKAAKVPIMIGTNANEGTLFVYPLLLSAPNTTVESYLESVGLRKDLVKAIAAAYPFPTVYEALSAVFTDIVFLCTTSFLASNATSAGYKVWRYYYDAVFPNESTFPGAGAYHGSEIPQVFGTYTDGFTPGQAALSKYMQTTWAKFAKNPGHPGWPSVEKGVLANLTDQKPYAKTVPIADADGKCALLEPAVLALIGY